MGHPFIIVSRRACPECGWVIRCGGRGAGGSSHIDWTYDDAYRLLSEIRRSPSDTLITQTQFTYDAVGNRLTQDVDGVITNYAYDNVNELISAGTATYDYDPCGNLTQVTDGAEVTQYDYDAQDRMTGVTLPDATVISYEYDADGRRTSQIANGTQTNYLWDEQSRFGDVVMEYDQTGTPEVSYTLADDKLISQTRGSDTSFYLADGQRSTRFLADESGSLPDSYDYTAYGEMYTSTGTTANAYLYTGQQFDALTGLYDLRARYYDPALGRFMTRDSYPYDFRNPIELNRYGYTANNPTNAFDASGHDLVETVQNIGRAVMTVRPLTGAVSGLFFGGLGSFLIYWYASSHMCSDDMYKWSRRLDPVKFVLLSAGIGAAAGGFLGLLPPTTTLEVSIAVGGAGAALAASAATVEGVKRTFSPCGTWEYLGVALGLSGLLGTGGGGGGGLALAANAGGGIAIGATALDIVGVTAGAVGGLVGIIGAAVLSTRPDGDDEDPPPSYKSKMKGYKDQLHDETLRAAEKELNGEVVAIKETGDPFDHVKKVRLAQSGLRDYIVWLKKELNYLTGLNNPTRQNIIDIDFLRQELSAASQLLDKSRRYVP